MRSRLLVIALMVLVVPATNAQQCNWTPGTGLVSLTCGNVGIGTSPLYQLHQTPTASGVAHQIDVPIATGAYETVRIAGTTNGGWFGGALIGGLNSSGQGYVQLQSLHGTNVNTIVYGDPSGNVGIGTTAPVGNLDVRGDSALYTTEAGGLHVINNTTSPNKVVQIGYDNGSDVGFIRAYQASTGLKRLAINPQGGFVGIGTPSPAFSLDVAGAIHSSGNLTLENGAQITQKNRNGATSNLLTHYSDDLVYLDNPDGPISIRNGLSLAPVIYADLFQRVGVGTTTPASTLDVLSTASAPLRGITDTYVSSDSAGSLFRFAKSRGVVGSYVPVAQGDALGNIGFWGNDVTSGAPDYQAGVYIRAMTDQTWSQTTHGAHLEFWTTANNNAAPAEHMRIDPAGNVGIGTTTPGATLDVNGTIHATSVTANTVIGAIYQDVAEWVPASEEMSAGTVVVLDPDHKNQVMPSSQSYDTSVAGVVSAAPGIILGEGSRDKAKIATTGRVKVRVDASKGAIRIGDLLVTSDESGVAMKSQPIEVSGRRFHQPGTILGKALEPLDSGQGEILVLLTLQ